MIEIIWTESALSDLRAIREYIARDSIYYAEKFVDDIFYAVQRLEQFPESGHIVPEKGVSNIREIKFSSYRIIYHIRNKSVYIVTIVHGGRNINL